jgi:hypothetical protein
MVEFQPTFIGIHPTTGLTVFVEVKRVENRFSGLREKPSNMGDNLIGGYNKKE